MLCHTDCTPQLKQLFLFPWCRQTLSKPLAQVSWQLHQLSHIPSASWDPSFQNIIALVVFLKIWVLFLGLDFLALCAVFSAVLPLFLVTGSWLFFSLKHPLFQIQYVNYFMGKEKGLWPSLLIFWEAKNKGMVIERTLLGNKSSQTNERCLAHTSKVCSGHAPWWLLVHLPAGREQETAKS